MKTLIKNAHVVLPSETVQASVLIEGDKIAAIDPSIATAADEVIDAQGLHLIPGVIDDQVHFREPGLTHKEDLLHASRACAAGGVTTFLEMPNTIPNAITQELLEENRLAMYEAGLWGVPSYRLLNAKGEEVLALWGQVRLWLVSREIQRQLAKSAASS